MKYGKHFDPEDLEFWFGDSTSGGGNCPAVMRAPGGYVVQGKVLDAATLSKVRELTGANGKATGPDETAVWIPDNILEQLRSGSLG